MHCRNMRCGDDCRSKYLLANARARNDVNMSHSNPKFPPKRTSFGQMDPDVTIVIDSVPVLVEEPCNFVGWAYQCLNLPPRSAGASAELHQALSLREFAAPQASSPPLALWNKLFNAGKYPGAKGTWSGRKLKLVQ